MKIVKQIKPFAIILLLAVALQSCQDKSKLLLKTWRIENLKYTTAVSPGLRETVDAWVEKMKTSFSLTYNADGTYITSIEGRESKGTWKMNWNSGKITSKGAEGPAKDFKIIELTENKFTFETIEGNEKVIFEMVPAK